jgi:translocation and assembly module TamB
MGNNPRKGRNWLRTVGIGVGLVTVGGGIGVGWRLTDFVATDLAPMIQKDLQTRLNRPVQLGPLEKYSWNSLKFGPSVIPAYRQGNKTDADSASVEAVEVQFVPLNLLKGRLPLAITLVKPKLFVDEAPDGQWLDLNITPPKAEGWLKTELTRVNIEDGEVTLDPARVAPRTLQNVNGSLDLREEGQQIDARGDAELDSGGQVSLTGKWVAQDSHLKLLAQTKEVTLSPLVGFLPEIPFRVDQGKLNGTVAVDYRPNQPMVIETNGTVTNTSVFVPSEKIALTAPQLKGKLTLTVKEDQPIDIRGDARLTRASIAVPEDRVLRNGRSQRSTWTQVSGPIKFLGENQRFWTDLKGKLGGGGDLQVTGVASILEQRANVLLQAKDVPAPLLDQAYGIPMKVRSGTVNGNLTLRLNKDEDPYIEGIAQLKDVDSQIIAIPQPFLNTNGYVRFKGLTATLEDVATHYGTIPVVANGSVNPETGLDLRAETGNVEVNQAFKTLGLESLPFPVAGKGQATNIRISGPFTAPEMRGQVSVAGTFDKVPVKSATAEFALIAPELKITNLVAEPSVGGKFTGEAKYTLTPGVPWTATLVAQSVPGNGMAALYGGDPGFPLGPINAQAQLTGTPESYRVGMDFQALNGEFPTQGKLVAVPDLIQLAEVETKIQGGQLLSQGQIQIAANSIEIQTTIPGLDLTAYSPELRGKLEGTLDIQGPFQGFSVTKAIAQGPVRLTEGMSLINDPIDAQIRWNGQGVEVQEATAPNFIASGILGVDLQGPDGPQLTTLDFDIEHQGYALAQLPFTLPADTRLNGLAQLQGQLSGSVADPALKAHLAVADLALNGWTMNPQMNGTLQYGANTGTKINLSGGSDRLQLALNSVYAPTSLDLRQGDAIAQGRLTTNDNFDIALGNIPLNALNWQAVNQYGYGNVAGTATGQFNLYLPTYALQGEVAVANPTIGPFKGDLFKGALAYRDGTFSLQRSELTQGSNRFLMEANYFAGEDPRFNGEIIIASSTVEDVLATFETLQFVGPLAGGSPAYGQAADVLSGAVGEPDASLLFQLQRLAEVDQLMAEREQQQLPGTGVPPLNTLAGAYQGKIRFNGSAATGVSADFDLQSDRIAWNEYPLDNLRIAGQVSPTAVNLSTMQVDTFGGQIAFSGQMGGSGPSGTLKLQNLSLAELTAFANSPLALSGQLGGEAQLMGTLDNPQLVGNLGLQDASLDQTRIQAANAEFKYDQARLNFQGKVDLATPQPVTVNGSIPYVLPFVFTSPTSDELAINLKVQNEGLSLMNLFTDQIAWEGGQGDLDVQVRGTLSEPNLFGQLTVAQATLSSPTLPEPIQQVNGQIQFNQHQMLVNDLRGEFSKGTLRVYGMLPIFANTPVAADASPLKVDLNNLALNLRGLYRGQVLGALQVSGSLLEPEIGGYVELSQGQMVLSDATAGLQGQNASFQAGTEQVPESAPTAPNAPINPTQGIPETSNEPLPETGPPETGTIPPAALNDSASPIQFKNLRVSLADNVRVLQPPLISFVTQGDLVVNGSLDAPRPQGIVAFEQGEVNLFTSIFRVNPRRRNYARFSPEYGLDPYLDVELLTTLSEVTSTRSTLNEFSDPIASALGTVDSVRVSAKVDGRASQLLSNFDQAVELTSNPNRSQGEILALLSGGLPEAIQGGNPELALANIASSAFLNRVQGLVDKAFGGRAIFRLFPVLIPNEGDRSVLAFGGELGYDLTDDFSVSLLQTLTGPEDPTRLNLSYDVNEKLRARTTVSFDGEVAGLLEYRFRF